MVTKDGDTPGSVALEHCVNVELLLELNRDVPFGLALHCHTRLKAGTSLRVPPKMYDGADLAVAVVDGSDDGDDEVEEIGVRTVDDRRRDAEESGAVVDLT